MINEQNGLIDPKVQPFWSTNPEGVVEEVSTSTTNPSSSLFNFGYDSRSEIMNDNMQARNDREAKAKEDYYAAKKQSEIQNTMFGGTALANTPNHNTEEGVYTSVAKSALVLGGTLLTMGLGGVPVAVAAAAGLTQGAKTYARDMNRSFRLNQALNGDLDKYTDLSIQDYILKGEGLIFQEEENSQIRKFQQQASKEQYVGSEEVFTNLTGLEATLENGFQGAGMYRKDWDSLQGKYGSWAAKSMDRITSKGVDTEIVDVGDKKVLINSVTGETLREYPLGMDPDKAGQPKIRYANTEQMMNEAANKSVKYSSDSKGAGRLASQIENNLEEYSAGWLGIGEEAINKVFGSQDDISSLRAQYLEFRNTEVLNALPPGVATDQDVKLFSQGFPTESWNPEQIASWLRGREKSLLWASRMEEFKGDYISNHGNLASQEGVSYLDAWENHAKSQWSDAYEELDGSTSVNNDPLGIR